MMTTTAKVFKSGNAQMIRIPNEFRLSSKTVTLVKTPTGFLVRDEIASARRLVKFAALAGSCPQFPKVSSNCAANLRRDWE